MVGEKYGGPGGGHSPAGMVRENRTPQVEEAVIHLAKAISTLEDCLVGLQERLTPILMDVPTVTQSNPNKPPELRVPFAQRIENHAEQILSLTEMTRSMLQRVEL